jgi:hypothetical protein
MHDITQQFPSSAGPNAPRCHDRGGVKLLRLLGHASHRGVAGNKQGEFEIEAQILSKLHTDNGLLILLKLLSKGTNNEACVVS